MSRPLYSDDQRILAARLYFLDGLSQVQIAKMVRVSQSKVSRMLALARERGLVRITVPDYEPRDPGTERALRRVLGIQAVVIRSALALRIRDLRQTVGYFAAPIVSEWVGTADLVAVAGGWMMQALAERMRPAGPVPGMTLVQAMGSIDPGPEPYDAVELGRTLARRWRGRFLTLNTPALLPDPETCGRFLALEQIRGVLGRLAEADLALVGIGTLENSVFVERRILAPADIDVLREAGAVGEILGRFFDPRGDECPTPFRRRVVSLGLDELRRLPWTVGVVAGADRPDAVLAAVRGGLLKSLVIDGGGASALLEGARRDPAPGRYPQSDPDHPDETTIPGGPMT